MPQVGDDEGSGSAELAVFPPMTSTILDAPFIAPDQMLVFQTKHRHQSTSDSARPRSLDPRGNASEVAGG